MLGCEKVISFLATVDAPAARSFYEGRLGLTLIHEDDFAIVFDVQGTELRIQKVGSFQPQPFTAMGWAVASIEKTVSDLASGGVVFERFPGLEQNELGIWTSPSGARIAWFKDPDGNMLSLTARRGAASAG